MGGGDATCTHPWATAVLSNKCDRVNLALRSKLELFDGRGPATPLDHKACEQQVACCAPDSNTMLIIMLILLRLAAEGAGILPICMSAVVFLVACMAPPDRLLC